MTVVKGLLVDCGGGTLREATRAGVKNEHHRRIPGTVAVVGDDDSGQRPAAVAAPARPPPALPPRKFLPEASIKFRARRRRN